MARGKNMTVETLQAISDALEVSGSFLLGQTKDPSIRPSTADELDFSEQAIRNLMSMYGDQARFFSELLEQQEFFFLLALWQQYVKGMSVNYEVSYSGSAEFIAISDRLKEHGYLAVPADDRAQALFSERITNVTHKLLDDMAERQTADLTQSAGDQNGKA